MNDTFEIQEALKELGLEKINNGSSTGGDSFSSGELLESYSPVDGKVVNIEKVFEKEYFKDDMILISIFMSPLNVHVKSCLL